MTKKRDLFNESLNRGESFAYRALSGLTALLEPGPRDGGEAPDGPVRLALIRERGAFARLAEIARFSFTELRRDPVGFVAALVASDPDASDRRRTKRTAWALTVTVPSLLVGSFVFGVLLYSLIIGVPDAVGQTPKAQPDLLRFRSVPVDGLKASDGGGGGGGGGDETPTPPSRGRLPKASLDPQIVTPTTVPPPPNPALPIEQTVRVDPRLMPPPDYSLPNGDPNGVAGPPSDGPGKNGIGTGKNDGVGSGDGPGVGPGKDGGKDGAGPGGGGPNTRPTPAPVAQPARILNSPRPNYTEQARQKKTQGVVKVRVRLGANGRVLGATIERGLPDGLNEQAIAAVYQLRFTPARDAAGRPVDSWMTVAVNFTIR